MIYCKDLRIVLQGEDSGHKVRNKSKKDAFKSTLSLSPQLSIVSYTIFFSKMPLKVSYYESGFKSGFSFHKDKELYSNH